MVKQKNILITGVSGGIGKAILRSLSENARCIITSSRRDPGEFWAGETWPTNASHISKDLTKEEEVKSVFRFAKEKCNGLDVVINCVGGSLHSHPIESFPANEFDEIIAVNLRSAFLVTKHAISLLKENGGNIVHFVSSSAKKISHHKAPYGCAKSALARLIQYAASEIASYGIMINGISPTYVFTGRHIADIEKKISKHGKSREEVIAGIMESQLIKKPMYPNDLISVVRLLSTTRVITGQIYNVAMGEILSY